MTTDLLDRFELLRPYEFGETSSLAEYATLVACVKLLTEHFRDINITGVHDENIRHYPEDAQGNLTRRTD